MDIPVIETERLRLRGLGPDDVGAVAAFYASDRAKYVGGPKTLDASWRAVATEIGHWTLKGFGRFAIEEKATGAFVGVTGPWEPPSFPEPELGWDLMEGFEGKGYATEAAAAARDWCYRALGLATLISAVNPLNAASARVAERLGAAHESDFEHELFGLVQIWRHPGPEASS
ncbi:MAG: GNAT family N-acetyltransferase [Pseudomonadota bacterium]